MAKVRPMRPLSAQERLKYEVAEELGLLERVMSVGWGGLTAVETGRIGGKVRARKKNTGGTEDKAGTGGL